LPGEAARRVVGALRNLPGNYKELWKEMLFLFLRSLFSV